METEYSDPKNLKDLDKIMAGADALTLKSLAQMTPAEVRARAKDVRIVAMKASLKKGRPRFTFRYEGKIKADTPGSKSKAGADGKRPPYNIIIDLFPESVPSEQEIEVASANLPCWVQCTCSYWQFTCEYAVTIKGSTSPAFIRAVPRKTYNYAGLEPRKTNPNMRPHLCKHLYAAMPDVLRAFKKAAKAYSEETGVSFVSSLDD